MKRRNMRSIDTDECKEAMKPLCRLCGHYKKSCDSIVSDCFPEETDLWYQFTGRLRTLNRRMSAEKRLREIHPANIYPPRSTTYDIMGGELKPEWIIIILLVVAIIVLFVFLITSESFLGK